jgi:predicted nucleotidyltransferase component of viral defense system
MKHISAYQTELIDAVLAEKDVGGLTAAILEKDIHVTDVLHELIKLQVTPFNLVFCGDTSLAKAHGIIERMSEDVDFKIQLTSDHGLSRNAITTQLKQFKQRVIATLESMGFVADKEKFLTQNENRYFSTAWFYQSQYSGDNSLRPHLSIEFTLRSPCFPTLPIPIGYLVNQLAELEGDKAILTCVAIEETLAEKVLSFLRRYASYFDEHQQNTSEWDSALVRHIYDVYCIVTSLPAAPLNAQLHFKALVALDADMFTQHAAFVENPRKCLLAALKAIEVNEQIAREYQTKLMPLIYGTNKPNFPAAFQVFERCTQQLLSTL